MSNINWKRRMTRPLTIIRNAGLMLKIRQPDQSPYDERVDPSFVQFFFECYKSDTVRSMAVGSGFLHLLVELIDRYQHKEKFNGVLSELIHR